MFNRLFQKAPNSITIDNIEYTINTDFRDCLKIICAFEQSNLDIEEKYQILLFNLYSLDITDYKEIIKVYCEENSINIENLYIEYGYDYELYSNDEFKKLYIQICCKKNKVNYDELDEKESNLLNDKENIEFPETLTNLEEAINRGVEFLDCGEVIINIPSKQKYYSFDKDAKYITSAMLAKPNGIDLNTIEYLHWWTFISHFFELGESSFSNIVYLRERNRKGKLTKEERKQCDSIGWDVINLEQLVQELDEDKELEDLLNS